MPDHDDAYQNLYPTKEEKQVLIEDIMTATRQGNVKWVKRTMPGCYDGTSTTFSVHLNFNADGRQGDQFACELCTQPRVGIAYRVDLANAPELREFVKTWVKDHKGRPIDHVTKLVKKQTNGTST